MSRYSKVRAVDGTVLRAWSNGATGLPVIISNGLGASPGAWPAVVAPGTGLRVVTWFHRGLGGSERPSDPQALRVEDHASDLGAVMTAAGMDRALVVGWSLGVNAAFEFARVQPERVHALLAVAGIAGGSLHSMSGVDHLPQPIRGLAVDLGTRHIPFTGRWLNAVASAAPHGAAPSTEPENTPRGPALLREFAAHDWDWYSQLAAALGRHESIDVSRTPFPVTFLGGRHDPIVSYQAIEVVARTIPGARLRIHPFGTHLLPVQYPALMLAELLRLAQRAGLQIGPGDAT